MERILDGRKEPTHPLVAGRTLADATEQRPTVALARQFDLGALDAMAEMDAASDRTGGRRSSLDIAKEFAAADSVALASVGRVMGEIKK